MGRAAVVVGVWLLMLLGAASAQALPSVTPECTPAPDNCTGWYTSDVSLAWTVLPSDAMKTGCQDQTFTTDTKATSVFCRAEDASGATTAELKIKVDKTPPTVLGGQPTRAADAGGWYNHAVGIAFAGSDLTSGIAGCTSTTYGGPDDGSASVVATCTDNAGNVSSAFPYGLKYDATAPVIAGAAPERLADHAGWFTSPVRVDISATDATSGLADCPAIGYAGPDTENARLTATCRDRAANVSTRSFSLKYDATAPPLSGLAAVAGDRTVVLAWKTGADAQSVEVVRTPGVGSEPTTVVFRGPGTNFLDTRVDNGVRYTYTVRLRDVAGNASSGTVSAVPTVAAVNPAGSRGRRLLAPVAGAILRLGQRPWLRWTAVRRARYYNVQLFRGGRKILSAWPSKARYRLKVKWRYRGERERLRAGRYRWIVWPGFGRRARANYGRQIGPSTFVVRRQSQVATSSGLR